MGRRPVRSGLPPPPRSPAQLRFPGACGIVFNFPGLWRERRGRGESLRGGIASRGQKSRSGLWPRQTLSRQELAASARDGFESRQRRVRVWRSGRTFTEFSCLGIASRMPLQKPRLGRPSLVNHRQCTRSFIAVAPPFTGPRRGINVERAQRSRERPA
jgi:hypothetical protein